MLRLINPGNILPNNHKVNRKYYFEPSMFAMFYRYRGEEGVECGLSNGVYVEGIIDDIFNDRDDSTSASNSITIWPLKKGFRFQTDQFRNIPMTAFNAPLWVSCNGRLTGEKNEFSKPVATLKKIIRKNYIEVELL